MSFLSFLIGPFMHTTGTILLDWPSYWASLLTGPYGFLSTGSFHYYQSNQSLPAWLYRLDGPTLSDYRQAIYIPCPQKRKPSGPFFSFANQRCEAACPSGGKDPTGGSTDKDPLGGSTIRMRKQARLLRMRKQARLIRPPSPLGARPFFDLFEGQISKLKRTFRCSTDKAAIERRGVLLMY